jgi:NitT/TauT family transport system substrate-binding protein
VAPGDSVAQTKLSVGLGYIPSVQFAQFYLAQQAGYYAEAGLDVEFQNKIDPDLITLVGAGTVDIGIGDGTSVMPAVSNGIPIHYIATIYGQFPNILFAKTSSGITKAADLKGKKIGTPGRYGSGWVFLQALLGSAGLTVDDVEIVEYPDFTQAAAVTQGAVDAATGFSNNEPVQLERGGTPTVVLHIDDAVPLPGPGLIAGTKTIEAKHDAITAFVAATLRAMNEIKANPTVGLDAAIKAVPELAADRVGQAAVLAATIDSWAGRLQGTRGLGAIDEAGWTSSIPVMNDLKLLKKPVTTEELVQTDLLPPSD